MACRAVGTSHASPFICVSATEVSLHVRSSVKFIPRSRAAVGVDAAVTACWCQVTEAFSTVI